MKRKVFIILAILPILNIANFEDDIAASAARKEAMVQRLWLDQEKSRDAYRAVKTYSLVTAEQTKTFVRLFKFFKNMINDLGQAVGAVEAINILDIFMDLMRGETIELPSGEILPYYEEFLEILDEDKSLNADSRMQLCQILKQIIESRLIFETHFI